MDLVDHVYCVMLEKFYSQQEKLLCVTKTLDAAARYAECASTGTSQDDKIVVFRLRYGSTQRTYVSEQKGQRVFLPDEKTVQYAGGAAIEPDG